MKKTKKMLWKGKLRNNIVIPIFQAIHCPVWHGFRSTKKSIVWWIPRTKVMAMLPLTRFLSKPWRDLILDRLLHVWHPIIMPRNPLPQTSPSIWDVSSIIFFLFFFFLFLRQTISYLKYLIFTMQCVMVQ